MEGRVVEVEDEGDGAVYAEIKDGAVQIGISVYDASFDVDELAKFIAGMTY